MLVGTRVGWSHGISRKQKEMDAGAKLAFSSHAVQDTSRWNDSTHLSYLKRLTDLARESSPR